MRWRGCGYTDIGLERQQNEDAFFVDNRSNIFIVSDGMGGVEGGEVASQLVVKQLPIRIKKILKKFNHFNDKSLHEEIKNCCVDVNELIRAEAKERNLPGMGATLVMVIIRQDQALIVHVGDSRCYLFRNQSLELLTEDHAADDGLLTHVMGADSLTRVDTQCLDLQDQDQLLLCSDGLAPLASDQAIQKILQQDLKNKAGAALIQEAHQAGGHDNITTIHIV